ncbi:MAG: hypothetical protein GXZ08_09320 [Tissierellia bacterium]|nr:hypothetical protein [Tissierellia bacterium]
MKILIQNIRYYDTVSKQTYEHVEIKNGKISKYLNSEEPVIISDYDKIIDGKDKFMIPAFYNTILYDLPREKEVNPELNEEGKITSLIRNGIVGFLNLGYLDAELIRQKKLMDVFSIYDIEKIDLENICLESIFIKHDKPHVVINYDSKKIKHLIEHKVINKKDIVLLDREITYEDIEMLNELGCWILITPVYAALKGEKIGITDFDIRRVLVGTVNELNVLRNLRQLITNERIIKKSPDSPKPTDVFCVSNTNYANFINEFFENENLGTNIILLSKNNLSLNPVKEDKYISNLIHTGQVDAIDTVISKGHVLMENGVIVW